MSMPSPCPPMATWWCRALTTKRCGSGTATPVFARVCVCVCGRLHVHVCACLDWGLPRSWAAVVAAAFSRLLHCMLRMGWGVWVCNCGGCPGCLWAAVRLRGRCGAAAQLVGASRDMRRGLACILCHGRCLGCPVVALLRTGLGCPISSAVPDGMARLCFH